MNTGPIKILKIARFASTYTSELVMSRERQLMNLLSENKVLMFTLYESVKIRILSKYLSLNSIDRKIIRKKIKNKFCYVRSFNFIVIRYGKTNYPKLQINTIKNLNIIQSSLFKSQPSLSQHH